MGILSNVKLRKLISVLGNYCYLGCLIFPKTLIKCYDHMPYTGVNIILYGSPNTAIKFW